MTRRTGFRIGPGTYQYNLSTNKGISPKIVRETFFKDKDKYDFFYVGNHIVRQTADRSRSGSPLKRDSNRMKIVVKDSPTQVLSTESSISPNKNRVSLTPIRLPRPQSSHIQGQHRRYCPNGLDSQDERKSETEPMPIIEERRAFSAKVSRKKKSIHLLDDSHNCRSGSKLSQDGAYSDLQKFHDRRLSRGNSLNDKQEPDYREFHAEIKKDISKRLFSSQSRIQA